MRLPSALLFASLLTGHAQDILFRDTFDRPDNRNVDAVLTGITDNTGSSLPADGVYNQPWLDPNSRPPVYGIPDGDATNGGGSQILGNAFQVKYGTGTANAFVNHNFTNAAIPAKGGFSVSLDVTAYTQATSGQGGGFAIGMSQAEAEGTADAFSGASRMTGAFGTTIGDAVPSQVASDFWIALRGNNSLAWGGKSGVISGITGLATKAGTITVNFTVPDFDAGSTVGYEVFLNGVSRGTGSFTWSGTNENHIGIDGRDSGSVSVDNFTIATVAPAEPPSPRPDVIVILVDDMGWGDLGCYGSEIPTPNLDALAANGVRFRQFYQSARCSPTRCSIMTGLYPQQAAVNPAAALPDLRTDNNVTFGELLGSEGYRTYLAGKWHLGNGERLPENRGFQHVWRFANGTAHSADCWNQGLYTFVSQGNEIPARSYGSEFHQTDAIGDYAVDFISHNHGKGDGKPFAMFLGFGAPHFPIQAPAAVADTFTATYEQGWDVIRQNRYDNQLATGVIDSRYPFPGLGGTGPHQAEPIVPIPAWNTLAANRKADLTRRMALYAAMIKGIDDNVGKVVAKLQQTGRLANTLIVFTSDNGGNHEGGVHGNGGPITGAALANMGQPGQNDGIHYGGGWAHVSNTPLKLFKHFTHEGGIRSPAIVHWPDGFSQRGSWVETPAHLIDVMGSIVDATGATYPATFNGHPVLPLEGSSLIDMIEGAVPDRTLFVEHEVNRMARKGKWKLVTENFTAHDDEFAAHQKLLYDMDADPGEGADLAAQHPAKVVELVDEWNAWSTRTGLPAARLIVPPPANVTPAPTPADLFLDTFNRAPATDIDATNNGMSGSRVPPLGSGTTWFEGFEGSGTANSIQITEGLLQMATGAGMSESGLNHNFTGQDIIDAGGFSVSLRILSIHSDATDAANRFAGFGVGLNATQAAGGNDIGTASPPPIRGNTGNPGTADCFLELDLNGNVKLWSDGALLATVPVGKTAGTLTAAFACDSFAAGATVSVSAYFDGTRLDLDPASGSQDRTFAWDEANANYLALSARASNHVQMDNFAVRKLPLSVAMAVEHALGSGLDGNASALTANPDGDRLDNFGEWAFGTDPSKADDEVSSTSLVIAHPAAGTFRFAHRRVAGFAAAGVNYVYRISEDLASWESTCVVEEAAIPLPASPGYEGVTLSVPPEALAGKDRLFLQIVAEP